MIENKKEKSYVTTEWEWFVSCKSLILLNVSLTVTQNVAQTCDY